MIYAAFMFLSEYDLLEIYLRENASVIDRFVIVESSRTFTNNPKPFHLDEQLDRFAPWLDRIIRVKVDDAPQTGSVVDRENFNRNCIMRGLENIKPDDVVILGDLDEIPRATAVAAYKPQDGIRSLRQRQFYWYVNVEAHETPWDRCKILPGSMLADPRNTPFTIRHTEDPIIPDAGWHFSSTGGADALDYKLKSFAHFDMPHNDEMVRRIRDGTWVEQAHCVPTRIIPIDQTYPAFVFNNVELMREHGLLYERV